VFNTVKYNAKWTARSSDLQKPLIVKRVELNEDLQILIYNQMDAGQPLYIEGRLLWPVYENLY
jgi:hypothetical protein